MPPIKIPEQYNYIGVFLTLACNYKCSYCINSHGSLKVERKNLNGKDWVRALNRIEGSLPVTLQGGEPSLHPDFYFIINNLKPGLNIDLLTNLQFDIDEFSRRISPDRIKRDAPYASIRVSYHPKAMDLDKTLSDVRTLLDRGYNVGIWAVLYPPEHDHILEAKKTAQNMGIDFRTKEFLGIYNGKLYGTYAYESACNCRGLSECECKTTELLIAPDGHVYQCHSHLYDSYKPVGNILDASFNIEYVFRRCDHFGKCNPCDIKVKTNRFQEYGHTSVLIKKQEQYGYVPHRQP